MFTGKAQMLQPMPNNKANTCLSGDVGAIAGDNDHVMMN